MKPQQQTPPTSTEYVEPLGFKGTKGEWDISGTTRGLNNYYVGTQNQHLMQVFTSIPNAEANAKLISQSKNLAKALQDMITWQYCFDPRSEAEKEIFDACCKNAKQVLKQAGLT